MSEAHGLIARAPVRVSFGGGGTDLAAYYARFGGFVVSAAIDRYCSVTASVPADGGLHVYSADYGMELSWPTDAALTVAEPLALPRAALEWFLAQGPRGPGVALHLRAQVPPGSGLGSSSAMAVALVRALAACRGLALDAVAVAERASWLEIERLGMPIGKQDQYASACGGLNAIEFGADGVRVTPLGLAPAVVAALEQRLLLFATGQTREAASILRQQQADSGTNAAVIDSLHQLKALAWEMAAALRRADLDGFGRLLDVAWLHKKRLSAGVSSAAIDAWYEAARGAGALGGKIAGAGGGGFLLLYCPPPAQAAVRTRMADLGLGELPFTFDFRGARVQPAPRGTASVESRFAGVRLPESPEPHLAGALPPTPWERRSADALLPALSEPHCVGALPPASSTEPTSRPVNAPGGGRGTPAPCLERPYATTGG
jgi:D-glycero-alpha-D-manno-heptose-7-phosphate kinase